MDTHGEEKETEEKGTWSQKLVTHLRNKGCRKRKLKEF